MGKIVLIVLLMIVACVVCYYIPVRINDRMLELYGEKIWSWWISAILGGAIVFFMFAVDYVGENQFVISVILLVLSLILAVGWCIYKGLDNLAEVTDIVLAVVAQLLSAFGVVIVILSFLAIFLSKKEKRKK